MRGTGTKLTIFTLVTIFVTAWLGSVIGNIQLFRDTYAINAVFDDATGILVGDPVKIAGVTVGKVTGFEVEGGEAHVSLEIKAEVELPENVEVEIKFRNLLGQRIVNLIEPEIPATARLEDDGVIPASRTRPALDLNILFNNLQPLIQSTNPEEINTVARGILKVFKGREGDLAGILGNVGRLTKTLAGRDQRLARLVTDLDKVTEVLNDQSGNIKRGLGRFTEFIESLAAATPRIERVVDQLDSASSKFGGLIARNRSNLDQELNDLRVLLGIVNDNLGPLDVVAKNLKEVLLAVARGASYGKWLTLYVVNFCPELGTGGCTGIISGGRQ